jgi:ATP-dependent Clp endopeptidase proteolytic subunit ClpP
MGETHIYIDGVIGAGFFSEGVSAKEIRSAINADKNSTEIVLHIDSPGGSVYDGYAIYNVLKASGKKITATVEGVCFSIATLIAMSADKIEMLPLAQWLVHNPYAGMEGDAEEMRKAADELQKIQNQLIDLYITKTGMSADEISALMKQEKTLTANEAMEMGFIDEVLEPIKAVAFWKNKDKKQNMTTDEKILDAFKVLAKKFDNLFKPKNFDATLEDGTKIYIEADSKEDINGKAIFVVTDKGNEPAKDGEYKMSDGTTIVVAGGVVSEVKTPTEPPAQDNMEDLKKQIEDLKGQLAAKNTEAETAKAEATTAKAEVETVKAEVVEVKNEFEKIRNTVLGSNGDVKKVFINKVEEEKNQFIESIKNRFNN